MSANQTQPCPSLYVSNLNINIKKDGKLTSGAHFPPVPLKRSLYVLFGLYGKVLDVVHVRAAKVRSKAFIVFRELAPATAALRALDGEAFYGLQLRVTYAKTPSHATIAYQEGPEAVYAIKLGLRSTADVASGSSKSKLIVSSAQKNQLEALKKAKRGRDDGALAEEEEEEEEDSQDGEGPEKKKGKMAEDEQEQADEQEEDDAMDEESDEEVPLSAAATSKYPTEASPSLLIEGLPSEVTGEMLLPLFQQYPGLSSVKLLPTPPGSGTNTGRAHAVYETVAQASTAKEALDQFLLAPQTPMSVNWMKKA